MNRRRKRRASPLPLICLLVVLATIVALKITELEANEQVASKLEISVSDTLSAPSPDVPEASQQVSAAENQLARAARYIDISITAEERDELAAIVFLEAGNQSPEGQQAIVEVVFNRVLHSGFPDTVHDVLHEGENTSIPQFSTIYRIGAATPTQAQYEAIDAALYGDTILDADVVFFSRNGENDRVWGQIGDHIFCREYIWE